MTNTDLNQLREEAEQRRLAIANDVELVTDRVAPGRIADRQKARVNQRVSSVRDSIFGTADRHRSPSSPEQDDPSMRDRAGDKMAELRERTPDSVEGFAEGNPLAAGLIGLGIGLLAASLLPSTDEEQRIADTAQDTLDSAAQQVARSGQEAAESIKPAVEDAAAEVKSSAQDSVESVKGDAREAAQDVQESARSKADDVRSDD